MAFYIGCYIMSAAGDGLLLVVSDACKSVVFILRGNRIRCVMRTFDMGLVWRDARYCEAD